MFADYLILTATVTTVTLIWRNLKDDHPKFKLFIAQLPYVGGSLSCGFCFALWASLLGVIMLNPLLLWNSEALHLSGIWRVIFVFVAAWFSVAAGVLFLRSVIIMLLESGAVLKHKHHATH